MTDIDVDEDLIHVEMLKIKQGSDVITCHSVEDAIELRDDLSKAIVRWIRRRRVEQGNRDTQ